ncbi:MAG: aldo/keto reductase [Pseudomonadota bacterium]
MQPTFNVAGVSIPRLGLGTYRLSGETCARSVAAALATGFRHIDTAEHYGNEEAVGEAIHGAGVSREEIFITSKAWHDHLNEGVLQASAEASLRRLGISAVDLYLIHWPNPNVPLSESLAALGKVQRAGLARAVGVSNFPPALLREALALTDVPLAVNQVEYQPYLDQSLLLSEVRAAGMGLTAYSPLAQGKVARDPVIGEIAERHGVLPAAISVAWLLSQDNVIAIPRSSSPERIAGNFKALDVHLSEGEIDAITALRRPDGRVVNPSFAPDWAAV